MLYGIVWLGLEELKQDSWKNSSGNLQKKNYERLLEKILEYLLQKFFRQLLRHLGKLQEALYDFFGKSHEKAYGGTNGNGDTCWRHSLEN